VRDGKDTLWELQGGRKEISAICKLYSMLGAINDCNTKHPVCYQLTLMRRKKML